MKRWIAYGVLTALVLCANGCSVFDEDPPPRSRSAAGKSSESKAKNGKERSRRDPVDDMFFGLGKRNDTPRFSSEGLNEDERSMVDAELRRQDEDMKALKSRHRSFDEDRKKRKEWVYGL